MFNFVIFLCYIMIRNSGGAIINAGSVHMDLMKSLTLLFLILIKEGESMDTEVINVALQAVSTVGFPIAACYILFTYMKKEQENHKEEVNGLKNVIAENNAILAQLKQLIEDKLP